MNLTTNGMRLIKLELLNLASLDRQEGEVIHFEEGALKDSTIFSIVGPTGSGKSTLLDAICLALYNRAPRYPRKKGDRNQNIEIYGETSDVEKNRLAPTDCRNILTRGKKEGYSKLTFLANNGQVYRAEWHVKFLLKKFAEPVTLLYKIHEKNGVLSEETADWDSLTQIIGLEYEQFLRTVLIAQGSFANFLTAKENERYELLEKLIGCEGMYTRMAADIKAKKEEAARAYEAILAHVTAFEKDLMTEQELEVLQTEIRELELADRKVKAELVAVNEALTWYATEQKYLANLKLFQQQVELAQQALERGREEFQRLKRHDETLPGMALFRDLKQAEAATVRWKGKLEELNRLIAEQQHKIKEGEERLLHLKEAEDKALQALDAQRPHINKARTLQGELDMARHTAVEKKKAHQQATDALQWAQREWSANQARITAARESLERDSAKFRTEQQEMALKKQTLEKEVEQAAELFAQERKKLEGVDANLLQQAKEKADCQWNDLLNAVRIWEEVAKKQTQFQENTRTYQQLLEQNQAVEKEGKALKVELLAAELETLQKTHTLMTSENWALHRQQLEEGKPCPLCGATEHPYRQEEAWLPVIHELQELIRQKKSCLEEQTRRREQLSQAWGVNNGKLQSIHQQQLLIQQELDTLKQEWLGIQAVHPSWTADAGVLKSYQPDMEKVREEASQALTAYHQTYAQAERLRQAWERGERQLKAYTEQADLLLRTAEQKLTELNTRLQTELGKTETLQQQVTEKTDLLNRMTQEWQLARKQIADKEEALKQEIGAFTPDELENQLMLAKNQANESVNRQNQVLTEGRECLKGWQGNQETVWMTWQQEQERLQQNHAALQQWMEEFNRNHEQAALTLLDIEELYGATDCWEEIRQKQTDLQTRLTTVQTTLGNEQKAQAAHQEQKPHAQQEELLARKAELESRSDSALTDAKARWQRHEAAKQQMGQLFEQRQATLQQKLEWEEMTDAIGGDGKTLRKIAQCYTLRFLIEHANAEIRRFNSRYELLQVPHSLGIRVIDHDRADDVRDTTSLSGGETFIVSLGLALGLSALSSRNISFENLFIDEGFGTLDPETLSTVIDSLALLQSSQGKKVGVISHTDTMSERITTQIRIIKNGHSGSSHLEIYP